MKTLAKKIIGTTETLTQKAARAFVKNSIVFAKKPLKPNLSLNSLEQVTKKSTVVLPSKFSEQLEAHQFFLDSLAARDGGRDEDAKHYAEQSLKAIKCNKTLEKAVTSYLEHLQNRSKPAVVLAAITEVTGQLAHQAKLTNNTFSALTEIRQAKLDDTEFAASALTTPRKIRS